MKLTDAKKTVKHFVNFNAELGQDAKNADYLIPMLWSLPGEGKTTMIGDLAEEMGYELETVVLGTFDPGELAGFPALDEENKEYYRARPFFLPREGCKPTILFFDEAPQAPTACQNILAQVVNERRIGEHRLPRNVFPVVAGNPMAARAGTSPMPTQLKDRLTHFNIETDHEGFRKYGLERGFLPIITSYIRERPEFLQKFDPALNASPSPRGWQRVNSILSIGMEEGLENNAIEGQIGAAALSDFAGYARVYRDIPDSEGILKDGENGEIPERPDVLYALMSSLAHKVTKQNAKEFVKYIRKLPAREFAAFGMRDAVERNRELTTVKEIKAWLVADGKELLL